MSFILFYLVIVLFFLSVFLSLYSLRQVTVAIDARNAGTFVDCATAQLPASLGDEWAKTAHLGVSASTGQLADNHDVLSLV